MKATTATKCKIAPQKCWLDSYFPFVKAYFQVPAASFRDGSSGLESGWCIPVRFWSCICKVFVCIKKFKSSPDPYKIYRPICTGHSFGTSLTFIYLLPSSSKKAFWGHISRGFKKPRRHSSHDELFKLKRIRPITTNVPHFRQSTNKLSIYVAGLSPRIFPNSL